MGSTPSRASALIALLVGTLGLLAILGTATAGASSVRWSPRPTTAPWQWQLQGKIDTSVHGRGLRRRRLRNAEGDGAPPAPRRAARSICYLDVGSWESYRPDEAEFPRSVIGRRYEGFPDERWLDIAPLPPLREAAEAALRDVRPQGLRRGRARQHRRLGKRKPHRLHDHRAPTSCASTAGSPARSTPAGCRWR